MLKSSFEVNCSELSPAHKIKLTLNVPCFHFLGWQKHTNLDSQFCRTRAKDQGVGRVGYIEAERELLFRTFLLVSGSLLTIFGSRSLPSSLHASNLSLLLQFSQALGNEMRGWCPHIALIGLGLPNPSPPGSMAHTEYMDAIVRANTMFPTFSLGTSGCLLLALPLVHMNRLDKSPLQLLGLHWSPVKREKETRSKATVLVHTISYVGQHSKWRIRNTEVSREFFSSPSLQLSSNSCSACTWFFQVIKNDSILWKWPRISMTERVLPSLA